MKCLSQLHFTGEDMDFTRQDRLKVFHYWISARIRVGSVFCWFYKTLDMRRYVLNLKKVFFAIEIWAHSTRRWRKERNGTTGKEWGADKHPHLSISLVIPVSRLKFVSGGDRVCECVSSSLWGKQATVKTLSSSFSLSREFLYLVCKICFVFCLFGGKISFTSSLGMNPSQQWFW